MQVSSRFTVEEMNAALAKTGGNVSAAARLLGVAKSTVQRALHKGGGKGAGKSSKPVVAPVVAKSKVGRSLTEFRQTYDKSTIVPAKIRAALKSLGTGWEYEVQFAKLAGVSLADLGMFRDQYAAHVVSLRDRRAWAGTAAVAQQMREMI